MRFRVEMGLSALVCFWAMVLSSSAAELRVDNLMFQDPTLSRSSFVERFHPRLREVWLAALARPDSENRRLAADAFANAVRRGMKNVEGVAEKLAAVLQSDPDLVVKRACANALVVLEARSTAPLLAEAVQQGGLSLALVVEPALARWQDRSLEAEWQRRVRDPAGERAYVLLAMQGLGELGSSETNGDLARIVESASQPSDIRLAAARALARCEPRKLLELARRVDAKPTRPDFLGHLLSVTLLSRHSDPESIEWLRSKVIDPAPVVAAAALDRLREIDLELAVPFASGALNSPDANVRRLSAEILIARGDASALAAARPLLADRNPRIRRFVAEKYVAFAAQESLKPIVLEQTMAALNGEAWQGLEQAALIVGTLDHEPAAGRLLELLPHPRPETAIAAAWALRKLQIEQTLPEMLRQVTPFMADLESPTAPLHLGLVISQVFQAFGAMRYGEAEPLLRKFVPKSGIEPEARAAAIWALGYLHEGAPEEDLARQFAERLADVASLTPEYEPVRRMSAVAIGRMKAASQLGPLRAFAKMDTINSYPGYACYWAIERIEGEEIPTPTVFQFDIRGWFLEPYEAP